MNPIRVLIVDDQPTVLKGLRMRLELEPDLQVVGEATNGARALEVAEQVKPNVVLMDVEMPVMDGIAATAALHTSTPDCCVIVLTIHDNAFTRDLALAAGATDFIAKHRIDTALLDSIRGALSASKGNVPMIKDPKTPQDAAGRNE